MTVCIVGVAAVQADVVLCRCAPPPTQFGGQPMDYTLASQSWAPIQVATYGMSVSSYMDSIDYFIGGAEVETGDFWGAPERSPQELYSERLVLIPGMGIVFDDRMRLSKPAELAPLSRNAVYINCPWSPPKISPEALDALAHITQGVCVVSAASGGVLPQLVFRLYTGAAPGQVLQLTALQRRVHSHITKWADCLHGVWGPVAPFVVEVVGGLPVPEYLARAGQGHFMLDMFPYAGCLTVLVCAAIPLQSVPLLACPCFETSCLAVPRHVRA